MNGNQSHNAIGKPLDIPSGFPYNNISSEIHIHRQIRPLHLADISPNGFPVLVGLLMPDMKREKRRKRILRLIRQTVCRIRSGRPCSPAGVPFHTDCEVNRLSTKSRFAAPFIDNISHLLNQTAVTVGGVLLPYLQSLWPVCGLSLHKIQSQNSGNDSIQPKAAYSISE